MVPGMKHVAKSTFNQRRLCSASAFPEWAGWMAWQLLGKAGYKMVADADKSGTNPGDVMRELFGKAGPSLVLIDEWVAYARQLYGKGDLPAGSFDAPMTFAQA